MRLLMFAAVFFARAGFGKVGVIVFKLFIGIAMTQLPVEVGIILRGLWSFLFDGALGGIAVVPS